MLTAFLIVSAIVAVVLLGLVAVCFYFYNLAIVRQKKEFLADNPDLATNEPTEIPIFKTTWVERQPFEDVEMKSYDGLLLRAYYLPAKSPTTKTAILAHGYNGRAKDDVALFAEFYHEKMGFNVLMADNRGHGESEGNYIGFGWHDRLDYLKWINYAIRRGGAETQVVLHGISMGGGIVLMTSGEPLPEQVKCIVSDCAYTSVKDILSYQLKRMYQLPAFPIIHITSLICKLRAGYFFGEASAIKQVSKTKKPVLFIHGDDDTFVPTSMMEPLYQSCQSYKEKLLVPKAGHGLAMPTNPQLYTQTVKAFVDKFIH